VGAANSVFLVVSKNVIAIKEQVRSRLKITMLLWERVTLMGFPIHLLDDENRKLISPIGIHLEGIQPVGATLKVVDLSPRLIPAVLSWMGYRRMAPM
jgi:hypothetical protein